MQSPYKIVWTGLHKKDKIRLATAAEWTDKTTEGFGSKIETNILCDSKHNH